MPRYRFDIHNGVGFHLDRVPQGLVAGGGVQAGKLIANEKTKIAISMTRANSFTARSMVVNSLFRRGQTADNRGARPSFPAKRHR